MNIDLPGGAQFGVYDFSARPFRRGRFGAADSAPRRFGAGRFGAAVSAPAGQKFGYFDLYAIQAPPPPSSILDPHLKSTFSMFQMIWSKKKIVFFGTKKIFLDLENFSKKNFFFFFCKIFFFFLFYNECEPNPLPPAKFF